MDPLSIAASSTALATFAFKASSAIYTGIEATKNIDTTILQLRSEVSTLGTSLTGIASTFQSSEVLELYASKSQSSKLLASVKPILDDCEKTLEVLGSMLEGIQGKPGKLNQLLRKPKAALRLHFKEGEIEGVRHQIRSYSGAMQMTLQMVGICLSLDGNKQVEFLGAVLTRQLSALAAQIAGVEQKLSNPVTNLASMNQSWLNGKEESRNMREHVRRAEAIFSSASEYAESISSTVIGDAADIADLNDVFGSVLGIDDEQKRRIHQWIPTGDVLTEDDVGHRKEINSTKENIEFAHVTDDKHDRNHKSNDTLEEDLFRARVTMAQKKLEAKEFRQAAAQFEACLAHPTLTLPFDEIFEMVLQLSEAYQGNHNASKQKDLLSNFLRSNSAQLSESRIFQLEHALGVACLDRALYNHLDASSPELCSAREHAEIAVKGRRSRFGSSHDDYHQSLSLLVTICKAQRDTDAAEVFTHLLPSSHLHTEEWRLEFYRNHAEQTLLAAGYTLNMQTLDKTTWKWAMSCGDLTTIRCLLRKYKAADIDANISMGYTRLHKDCVEGNIERVRILLKAGANPNTRDKYSATPLLDAVKHGRLEIVSLLLENGAPIDTIVGTETSLMLAAKRGNVEMVRLLLESSANTAIVDWKGRTALDIAIKKKHPEVVLILETTHKYQT